MKVAVVTNWVPFVRGGAEYLAESLTSKLIEFGHQAILVRLPFCWEPPEKILESMLAARLMRLPDVDRAIGLKFPAYYIPHPDKVLWLLHQFRQAYDLWGTEFQGLPNTQEGMDIRAAITRADNTHLQEARKIYTNSHVTSERLKNFNGLDSEVLYPPLLDVSGLGCDGYGDFVFCPSRITASKRQHLLVESMRHVRSGVRLIIAGKEEAETTWQRLERIISQHRLESRVTLLARFISEEEKAGYFRRALACAYVPYDEDSYGYVTLEAFHCRKPVVTCSDSGGINILVKDGQTGFSVPPEPRAIAQALDRLFDDTAMTRRMGEAGYDLMRTLKIDWNHVIGRLTQ